MAHGQLCRLNFCCIAVTVTGVFTRWLSSKVRDPVMFSGWAGSVFYPLGWVSAAVKGKGTGVTAATDLPVVKAPTTSAVVDPLQAAMAQVISWARREQRLSVRLLVQRMDVPLSMQVYYRFQTGRKALPEQVMASICRVLGIQWQQVALDAAAIVAATGTLWFYHYCL